MQSAQSRGSNGRLAEEAIGAGAEQNASAQGRENVKRAGAEEQQSQVTRADDADATPTQ